MKAKLHYVFSIAMFLFAFSVIAQNSSWKKLQTIKDIEKISKYQLNKNNVVYFELNAVSLKQTIAQASKRTAKTKRNNTVVTIPGQNGELESFNVFEAPVFSPELAEKFPDIKSYVGYSLENPDTRIRMSVSHLGIKTMVSYVGKPTIFMEPTSRNSNQYILYSKNSKDNSANTFECRTIDELNRTLNKNSSISKTTVNEGGANDQTLQKFRIAISVTGEYTNYFGGVADALAGINATLTRVNEIFETDMAVTFELVDATQLIYTNANTDPYSDADIGTHEDNATNSDGWNIQLQNTLTNVIGEPNYDIGHLFGASGGGGNAGCIGCVCVNDSKGSAYTSPANNVPEGDTFDLDFVVHEIGHQMGASHTFAYENEGTGVNSEPGSGSTIMAYAGITGDNNVQSHSDAYFHYHSIKQILNNLSAKNCQTTEALTNTPPIANAGNDYNIPAGTAYVLKGAATDADGTDALTYCWEQIDSGSVNYSSFGPTLTSGSMNRSLSPSSSPDRYIPKLSSVVAGHTTQTNPTLGSDWETVSTVGRDLNWSLTVRDRNPLNASGAQTSFDTMVITVEDVTPFTVSNPISWAQGDEVTITWTVGETANATINCQSVNIKLSTDGGLTFSTIAPNIENNGSYTYTVPQMADTDTARLLVEAADNIFYDVSDFDFIISQDPSFSIIKTAMDDIICNGTSVTYTFDYVAVNGFSDDTVFSVSGIPNGASAVFSPTNLTSSDPFSLTISDLSVQGDYTFTLTGTSSSITKSISVDLPFYNGLCSSVASAAYNTSTTRVRFNTIDKVSSKPSGYSDYRAEITDVYRDIPYDLTVNVNTDGNYAVATKVWIDWNQNCRFDDTGEEYNLGNATNVTNGATSNSPLSITVPSDALSGNTTMRVSTKYRDDGLPTACENGFDGEVEDYTINILEADFVYDASITMVEFNTINQTSEKPSDYSDYSSITTDINRDSNYNLTVNVNTEGNFTTATKAWIDWNQNSSFEDDEAYDLGDATNVSNEATNNSPLSINVPMDAVLGNTIMRIATRYIGNSGDQELVPTENGFDGEVEDYTLTILPTMAIENFGFDNLKVYPNPNNGIFTIQLNGSLERTINVNVFDIRGRHIYDRTFQNNGDFSQEISLSNVQSSVYILYVSDGLRKSAKKLIVE